MAEFTEPNLTFDEWFSEVQDLHMKLGSLGGILVKDQRIVLEGYARGDSPREFFDFLERTYEIRDGDEEE